MHYLVDSPVAFIQAVTPLESFFILFCAVWLPWITIGWTLVYVLYRPIPNKDIWAPFENISLRLRQLAIVSVSALVAVLASNVLKNYFQIVRPYLLNYNFHPLLSISDYGFPSSHAAVFSAIGVALLFVNRRAGTCACILALVIGAARIFAGVHTPLDILGGYLLGTLIAVITGYLLTKKPVKASI